MKLWGGTVDIIWGDIEDKYLGFNIRKGFDPSAGQGGYFATKKGKVIALGTGEFQACRSILEDETAYQKKGKEK